MSDALNYPAPVYTEQKLFIHGDIQSETGEVAHCLRGAEMTVHYKDGLIASIDLPSYIRFDYTDVECYSNGSNYTAVDCYINAANKFILASLSEYLPIREDTTDTVITTRSIDEFLRAYDSLYQYFGGINALAKWDREHNRQTLSDLCISHRPDPRFEIKPNGYYIPKHVKHRKLFTGRPAKSAGKNHK